jgi:hypothetical protein
MKDELYRRLKRYDEIKNLRWYKDKSYLRFYIYDNSYQIVVSPQYKTFDHLPVSFNGRYVKMTGGTGTCHIICLAIIVDGLLI